MNQTEAAHLPSPASCEKPNLFAGRKARILLAEDDFTNRQVALGILKKLGLAADAVENGREALKALETLPYDLVLMDVQMPVMDGFEATKKIRIKEETEKNVFHASLTIHHASIPIIALTAHAMQGDRERFLAAGMNDHIAKPVSSRSLAAALDKWLPKENEDTGTRNGDFRKKNADGGGGSSSIISNPSCVIPDSPLIFDRTGMMDRLMHDAYLARVLVKAFLKNAPKQIESLKGYLKTGDVIGVERQAHTIRGASASVGGEALAAVALKMETAGKAGDLEAVKSGMAALESQFDRLKQTMTTEMMNSHEREAP